MSTLEDKPPFLSRAGERYREEFEKYKNVELKVGKFLLEKGERKKVVEILRIDEALDYAIVKIGDFEQRKTLHWCRKYLKPLVE